MGKVVSNKPFSKQCNVRAGGGPVYSKFCPPTNTKNGISRGRGRIQIIPCFGPYDNLVGYVYETDLTNANNLAYVDCDYVD